MYSISIHALREESDLAFPRKIGVKLPFQSTLSVRRATHLAFINFVKILISIHALREESDDDFWRLWSKKGYISIHALREESDV